MSDVTVLAPVGATQEQVEIVVVPKFPEAPAVNHLYEMERELRGIEGSLCRGYFAAAAHAKAYILERLGKQEQRGAALKVIEGRLNECSTVSLTASSLLAARSAFELLGKPAGLTEDSLPYHHWNRCFAQLVRFTGQDEEYVLAPGCEESGPALVHQVYASSLSGKATDALVKSCLKTALETQLASARAQEQAAKQEAKQASSAVGSIAKKIETATRLLVQKEHLAEKADDGKKAAREQEAREAKAALEALQAAEKDAAEKKTAAEEAAAAAKKAAPALAKKLEKLTTKPTRTTSTRESATAEPVQVTIKHLLEQDPVSVGKDLARDLTNTSHASTVLHSFARNFVWDTAAINAFVEGFNAEKLAELAEACMTAMDGLEEATEEGAVAKVA